MFIEFKVLEEKLDAHKSILNDLGPVNERDYLAAVKKSYSIEKHKLYPQDTYLVRYEEGINELEQLLDSL